MILDSSGLSIPVIDFKMKEGQIIIMNYDKNIISACFVIESNFYNPKYGEWEPFVELATLSGDSVYGENYQPKLYISIDTNANTKNNKLNINISDRLVSLLFLLVKYHGIHLLILEKILNKFDIVLSCESH